MAPVPEFDEKMKALLASKPLGSWFIPGTLCLGVMLGCASRQKADVWKPPPRVDWFDILTVPFEPMHDGYVLVMSEPTAGLFPASIGVTRLVVERNLAGEVLFVKYLARDPRNEFLRWNSAFDDQMAISEVFPIDERDLGGAPADPAQVLAAFHALHARVGLVYAVNELSESETEMLGALYDVAAAEPLAVIRARASSVVLPDGAQEPVDLWKSDSRALVRAEFEAYVYECIRELIARDTPAVVESPNAWKPDRPIWPPGRFESGQ
ncbi:MAG: hypothetical protein KJ749_05570 [Planctomycetes bacterium]|nr:hypothetical protein [Planctomycetota bacterium]